MHYLDVNIDRVYSNMHIHVPVRVNNVVTVIICRPLNNTHS